jgi:hypothetical protein
MTWMAHPTASPSPLSSDQLALALLPASLALSLVSQTTTVAWQSACGPTALELSLRSTEPSGTFEFSPRRATLLGLELIFTGLGVSFTGRGVGGTGLGVGITGLEVIDTGFVVG